MALFLRIDINIVAMVLLGIIVLIAGRSLEKKEHLNITFIRTSCIILLELFFETTTCILNGRPEQWAKPLSALLHVCLFGTGPLLTYFLFTLVCSWLPESSKIKQKTRIVLLVPVAINVILALLSPMYGFIFYFSDGNIYHRGSLFLISAAIIYFYLILSLAVVLLNRNKMIRQDFLPLFIFGILPILGGLLQTLFYGILLMWSTAAFSLIIVYNFLHQRMIHLDRLTGAWTRYSFDYYMSRRFNRNDMNLLGIIFMDLDGLKRINDEYGHLEGDAAIKSAIALIKAEIRKTDIVVRFGGDEFVIVLDCESRDVLDKTIERINARFAHYNETSQKAYKLEFSVGADVMNSDFKSLEQFLHHVDNLMYSNKKLKKMN